MRVSLSSSHCLCLRLRLATAALLVAACASPLTAVAAQPLRTLEQKLKVLAACGIKLARPFTVADLLKVSSRKEYEKPGWYLLLDALASEEEHKPWRPLCENLWGLDVKCIEDNGDYKKVAKRMVQMAQGSLVLHDIKDHVDVMKGEAWLSFKVKARRIKLNCHVDGKWLDPRVLSVFVGLLKTADPTKIYIVYDAPGEETMLIGCVKKSQLRKLNEHGIKFVPLK